MSLDKEALPVSPEMLLLHSSSAIFVLQKSGIPHVFFPYDAWCPSPTPAADHQVARRSHSPSVRLSFLDHQQHL